MDDDFGKPFEGAGLRKVVARCACMAGQSAPRFLSASAMAREPGAAASVVRHVG